ncbi:TetR/AcrR family transcriptional regulator [Nocardiopsis sp. LOL_012]|uniref:TetR/AcrR family transcriptional regulator n=1 Tax=Nocardiopsis sp. LOL_012 TaxID=3345409 RepID=UPI003A83C159
MPGTEQDTNPRQPLNRDRILAAALDLADTQGLGALTMRSLAHELGVRPMSLYRYIHDKEDLLDGMVDLVFSEIALPDPRGPWRGELRRRAVSARRVLARHPWALALLDTRTSPGPATLRHHDAVLGLLMNGGFSPEMTERAYTIVDSYVYGFVIQDAALSFEDPGGAAEAARSALAALDPKAYPHLAAFAAGHLVQEGYAFADQFEPGLDLLLDAIGTLAQH